MNKYKNVCSRALTDSDISHIAQMLRNIASHPELSSHHRNTFEDIRRRSTDPAYRISRRRSAGLRIHANAEFFNLEFVAGSPTIWAYLYDRDTREVEYTADPDLILSKLPGMIRQASLVRVRGGIDYFGWDEAVGVYGGQPII